MVDEAPSLVEVVALDLDREGFRVLTAEDGAHALEIERGQPRLGLAIADGGAGFSFTIPRAG